MAMACCEPAVFWVSVMVPSPWATAETVLFALSLIAWAMNWAFCVVREAAVALVDVRGDAVDDDAGAECAGARGHAAVGAGGGVPADHGIREVEQPQRVGRIAQ